MKTLNFGSLNIDMVYSVDHSVRSGETEAASSLEFFCGGKGLNQSIALSRAGVKVFHAGCVGNDGKLLLDALAENNVDTSFVEKVDMQSGHAVIQVDRSGKNSILVFGGANRAVSPKRVENVLEKFCKGDRLFIQNEISCVEELINSAYRKGMQTVFNPSPFDRNVNELPLEKISWLAVNEIEAYELTGESEADKILDAFSERFPSVNILLTLGENGSCCRTCGKTYYQGIFEADAVDTTAAGDTFLGFFFAVLDSLGVEKALEYASAAAAVAVSRSGAAASIPSLSEVENFITRKRLSF